MSKQSKKIRVELAGIYAVASRLCQEGYLAIPVPSGHYPDIDIIVHDLEKGRLTGIQVKTLEKKERWRFPPSKIHPTVFVTLKPLEFYVHDRDSIRQIVEEMKRLKPNQRWIDSEKVEDPAKRDKWENIWLT